MPKAVIKRLLRPLYVWLIVRYAARVVKRRHSTTLADDVDFALNFRVRNLTIAPVQVRAELEAMLELVADEKPRTVLEIGTAHGGTLFLFTRVAADDALLVSVDLADEAQTRFEGGDYKPNAPLYEAFARDRQTVAFITGDSHKPGTAGRVKTQLRGRPVDLLFIDGDHTYEGVKADYETYAPLVREGGLVAFHDIVDGPADAVGGVPRFWREIKNGSSVEIVDDRGQGGYGFGVLRA